MHRSSLGVQQRECHIADSGATGPGDRACRVPGALREVAVTADTDLRRDHLRVTVSAVLPPGAEGLRVYLGNSAQRPRTRQERKRRRGNRTGRKTYQTYRLGWVLQPQSPASYSGDIWRLARRCAGPVERRGAA